MEDKQNWLTVAAVVIVIGGLGLFLYRQSQQVTQEEPEVNQEQVQADQRADQLVDELDLEIPENAQRLNLRDVTGGSGAGVVTRQTDDASEEVDQALLVALPDPEPDTFYEAYAVSAEDETLYLGKLSSVKGGWRLDYQLNPEEAERYSIIRITQETSDDQVPETVILEGEFTQE